MAEPAATIMKIILELPHVFRALRQTALRVGAFAPVPGRAIIPTL